MKTSELKKLLREAGCKQLKGGTNHEVWINPKTGEKFRVWRHKTEVATGTAHSILKAAGLK